jgi:hypothetical protein
VFDWGGGHTISEIFEISIENIVNDTFIFASEILKFCLYNAHRQELFTMESLEAISLWI